MSNATPVGVLLSNTGSPRAPTAAALRTYLAEFLSDPRVVDLPRWLWWPILHGVVLRSRPRRSAALYQRLWTEQGAPLIDISKRQTQALAERLGADFVVAMGMRYGEPSLAAAVAELRAASCQRVIVLPMFPQFAEATVGSILAAATPLLGSMPWVEVPPFFDDPGYIAALANSIRAEHADEHLLISFHGLPQRQVRQGDPYPEHCRHTAEQLARQLKLRPDQWSLSFQSRFGPGRWLEPATDVLVCDLAKQHSRLLVVCPGFSADCLESLDEIGCELAKTFMQAGGQSLRLVPCLNDNPDFMDCLAKLVSSVA